MGSQSCTKEDNDKRYKLADKWGQDKTKTTKKAKPFTATLYLSRAATAAAKALASSQATPSLKKGPIKL